MISRYDISEGGLHQTLFTGEHPAPLGLFCDLSEMKPVNGIGDGKREEPRLSDEGPEEKFPKVVPFSADNPEEQDRFEQRSDIPSLEMKSPQMQGAVLPEEPDHPLIVIFGCVDRVKDGLVPVYERIGIHSRDKVEVDDRIAAGTLSQKSPLPRHALVELGPADGGKQADHGGYDAAFLYEEYLLVEDRGWIAVKADDKPSVHLQAGPLDALDRSQQVAVPVLHLAALGVALLARSFDADKDLLEPGPDHHFHESGVVSQVDGRLGIKIKGVLFPVHPVGYGGKDLLFQLPFVADEVVVDKEDRSAPPPKMQAVQFSDQLFPRLAPRPSPEQRCDVAELAVKGASPAILDIHGGIIPDLYQVPKRDGSVRQVRPLVIAIEMPCPASTQVHQERREGEFRFTQHQVVHLGEIMVTGGKERTAGNGLHSQMPAAGDDFLRRFPLDGHGADEDVIRPLQICVGERARYSAS